MGTYDSNSACSFSSSCNIPSYSQATQALGALFRWTEEQSKLDLQFEDGMARGYKKCNVDVGTYVDKEVWTQGFFRQVREELSPVQTRKRGRGNQSTKDSTGLRGFFAVKGCPLGKK